MGRILRILWLVPAMDRLWIEGAEGQGIERAAVLADDEQARRTGADRDDRGIEADLDLRR